MVAVSCYIQKLVLFTQLGLHGSCWLAGLTAATPMASYIVQLTTYMVTVTYTITVNGQYDLLWVCPCG